MASLFSGGFLILIIILLFYLISSVKILAEYERGVIFRLGRVLSEPKVRVLFSSSRHSTASCAFTPHRGYGSAAARSCNARQRHR